MVEGLPPNFEGTLYRVLTPYPYAGNGRWELEAISASGRTLTDIPVPPQLYNIIYPVEISPDGRYVVFQPIDQRTELVIWDRISNAITSSTLPSETLDYLNADPFPLWREQRKLDWVSANMFIIRYFDLDNSFFLQIDAEQLFTVSNTSLSITAGAKLNIEYPQLPFPEIVPLPVSATINVAAFSPIKTYLTLGSEGSRTRFQIYNARSLQLLVDFDSNVNFDIVGDPIWSGDERKLFLQYRDNGPENLITEIDVNAGFQESADLLNTLYQTLGQDFSTYSLRPSTDNTTPRLIFTARNYGGVPYILTYNWVEKTLAGVCRTNTTGSSPIAGSLAYPVWGPDESIISYYENGNIFTFDIDSGKIYYQDVYPFVGWINSPDEP